MTALITGGAKGIGKATAIALCNLGYTVYINYNTSNLQANELAGLCGVIPIKADIRDIKQVEQMVSIIGSIDVLVNNAGIAQQKLFTDITSEDWDNMFDTNVKGIFHTCKCVLPNMIKNKYGKIINISSIWGQAGASCEVHYSASKAAVIGLTKALAKEVGLSGINVNCICPGVISTDMNSQLDNDTLSLLQDETSLNRLGTPEDIAELVAFLASDKSSFITGQVIVSDGGMI